MRPAIRRRSPSRARPSPSRRHAITTSRWSARSLASPISTCWAARRTTSTPSTETSSAPKIAEDGSLGAFEPAGEIPNGRAGAGFAVVGDDVVLLGGVVGVPQTGFTNEILVARFSAGRQAHGLEARPVHVAAQGAALVGGGGRSRRLCLRRHDGQFGGEHLRQGHRQRGRDARSARPAQRPQAGTKPPGGLHRAGQRVSRGRSRQGPRRQPALARRRRARDVPARRDESASGSRSASSRAR